MALKQPSRPDAGRQDRFARPATDCDGGLVARRERSWRACLRADDPTGALGHPQM